MVDVTDGSDVDVRLVTDELFFGHGRFLFLREVASKRISAGRG